jgi:hypothetical protein
VKKLPSAKYIIWSCDPDTLDDSDPWVRRWWISQVLQRGRMRDIQQLDLNEVRDLLPSLDLPEFVRLLWSRFFDDARSHHHPDAAPDPRP